jgi:hypothetical protein
MNKEILNRVKKFFGIILIIIGILGFFSPFSNPYILVGDLFFLLGVFIGAWLISGLLVYVGYRLYKPKK